MPFGERQQLEQAQAGVPLPNTADRLQAAINSMNSRPSMPDYGNMLDQPTEYPQEPVTAGMPIGPGPGPESVPAPMIPATIDDAAMAKVLPMLETLADQPNASNQTRNFVRMMRGALPPGLTMANVVRKPQPNQPTAPPPPQLGPPK
jgi:hypothetical protein